MKKLAIVLLVIGLFVCETGICLDVKQFSDMTDLDSIAYNIAIEQEAIIKNMISNNSIIEMFPADEETMTDIDRLTDVDAKYFVTLSIEDLNASMKYNPEMTGNGDYSVTLAFGLLQLVNYYGDVYQEPKLYMFDFISTYGIVDLNNYADVLYCELIYDKDLPVIALCFYKIDDSSYIFTSKILAAKGIYGDVPYIELPMAVDRIYGPENVESNIYELEQ